MNILVFSDTHGSLEEALRAVSKHPEADEIIHLGDNIRDAEKLQGLTGLPVTAVKGNCDLADSPDKILTVKDGARILLTHGNSFGVGYSLLRLTLAAEEEGADAVLFGHTHRSLIEYDRGILLMNPGSPSRPRGCSASYAMLKTENGLIYPQICTLDG